MKFSELIAKISGVDPSKEYDLQLTEIKEETTVQTPPEPQTPPKNDNDEGKGAENNSSSVELEALKATIAAQNKSIEELKAANFALLSRTPTKKDPDFDEMVLSLAGYAFKEESNGNT